ncbi:PIN domain-containing protein [Pseudobythopirellula maris]|uniref:PIN domain-containing protein n=1 Tax=Pseudobythopirellula maris TaxID=2527991 RepID=UPI0011B6A0F6|nr:PIN domain-containing protein [Pseudobythopirellula maris]
MTINSISSKPLCVVLDTNIWIRELLLQSYVGKSLVYAIRRRHAQIGFPQIVEGETVQHMLKHAQDAADSISDKGRVLSALSEGEFTFSQPEQSELEAVIHDRISDLNKILVRVPFTHEHAIAALDMVERKLPPNGDKNQQFKDSAIWQAVLQLSKSLSNKGDIIAA